MVPRKGRNAAIALERELADRGYDTDWLTEFINDRGKTVAKTGDGLAELQAHVESVGELFDLIDEGRLEDRAVFNEIEHTAGRIESYETPTDAFSNGCTRFYAGYDRLLERAPRSGADGISDGFEAAVREIVAEVGFELEQRLGDDVRWAAMTGRKAVPSDPDLVLVPEGFRGLGRTLANEAFDSVGEFESYDGYAESRGRESVEEEALLAEAAQNPAETRTVAGIYMYVSGSTADACGLTYRPIEGAVSRLGVFRRRDTDRQRMPLDSLKGFHDRYPAEFAAWRAVIDVVEETAREFGFRELETPAVERTELYRIKSGDELMEQTYSFTDRGDRAVTLLPEQTPTRARLVQQRKDLKSPIKWFDTSKRWRFENVQRGRDREFFQTDFDIFGIESVEADAEVIACGATVYRKLGVADSVEFLVNDRRLLESLLESVGVSNTTEVMGVIDDREKLAEREFLEELETRGLDAPTAQQVADLSSLSGPILDTVEALRDRAPDDEQAEAAIDRMADLADALDAHGVASMCTLDLSIVRGLAYYTGLVFEAFDSEGELRALFGGGRYDDLVGLFGSQELPAVGFAFGYSTTRELLQREGAWPEERVETDVYVLSVSESLRAVALEHARELRDAGLTVETDLAGRSVGGQFSYADSINADQTIVIGQRDLEEGVLTVQDMESGEEAQVDLDDVTAYVREQATE